MIFRAVRVDEFTLEPASLQLDEAGTFLTREGTVFAFLYHSVIYPSTGKGKDGKTIA
jgi:hypothetical protein